MRRQRHANLVWGVYSVPADEGATDVLDRVNKACAMARGEGFAQPGNITVIATGMPFGTAGTTNLLYIAQA